MQVHVLRPVTSDQINLDAQIVSILKEFGGEAHRDLIAGRLLHLQNRPTWSIHAIRVEVDTALTALESAAGDAPFKRVFGPGSHRWALRDRTKA